MMIDGHTENLLVDLPNATSGEVFVGIVARPECRIERIVSHGQITPAARPYIQAHDERVFCWPARPGSRWAARRPSCSRAITCSSRLAPSNHVTFTNPIRPTVWFAVRIGEA